MFNKNGSNNGNGSANGVHKDTAVVARNGNGHKPDAAIVSEHELLWDGLSPAVTQALGQPLDPELVSQRKGRGGRSFDYLEGHAVIDQANLIFGYGGWGYELAGDVTLRQIETVNPQTGEVKVEQGYSAPVRVSVAGALPRTDLGVHPVTEDNFDGHDTAMKAAVTDGMKRAFRSFGVQFGNGFYGDQPQVGNQPQPQRVPAPSNGRSGQAQANGKGRSESQIEKLRKRLFEIAAEQGLDEDQVRSAVVQPPGDVSRDPSHVNVPHLGAWCVQGPGVVLRPTTEKEDDSHEPRRFHRHVQGRDSQEGGRVLPAALPALGERRHAPQAAPQAPGSAGRRHQGRGPLAEGPPGHDGSGRDGHRQDLQCAALRGIGYLAQLGRPRRKFLGQPTHLEAKA